MDAFRAQYFITALEDEIGKTNKKFCQFNCFSKPFKEILQDFSYGLFIELDQLLLPTIVFEIHKAKQLGDLIGDTPRKRYESFFVVKLLLRL